MPAFKQRTSGAWVAAPGGPTHARIGGGFEELAAAGEPVTYTLFATSDGHIVSPPGTAEGDGNTVDTAVADLAVGRSSWFFEGFLAFDTSAVVGTITAVTLSLTAQYKGSAPFTVEARAYDWGPTLTTADWRQASLASLPLLATRALAGIATDGSYNDFTSEAAFLTNINQSGTTYVILNSDLQRAGDWTDGSYIGFDSTKAAVGNTKDPKLVIEAVA